MAAAQRTQREQEAAEAARAAAAVLRELTAAHLEQFEPATRPVAPDPFNLDVPRVEREYEKAALKGVSRLDISARRAAKADAQRQAQHHISAARAEAEAVRAEWQRDLNHQWDSLLANDPELVFEVVGHALGDNGAWAAPVGVDGAAVSIVMVAPADTSLPELKPHQKASGVWATKKLTAAERAALYLETVSSNVLATAKEAFAVAPGIESMAIAVIRNEAPLGAPDWKVLCIVETDRSRFSRLSWSSSVTAANLLGDAADVEIRFRANSVKILPLNPRQSGAAAEVLKKLEPDDDAEGETSVENEAPDDIPEISSEPTPPDPGPSAAPAAAAPQPPPPPPPPPSSPAPGWQLDPWNRSQFRYWDGSRWTSHTAPQPPNPPST